MEYISSFCQINIFGPLYISPHFSYCYRDFLAVKQPLGNFKKWKPKSNYEFYYKDWTVVVINYKIKKKSLRNQSVTYYYAIKRVASCHSLSY